MVYCQKCGKQNADDAKFCSSCATPLAPTGWERQRRARDEECEEECPASGRRAPIFWGIIIVLVGISIVFEGLKNVPQFQTTLSQIQFWWIIPIVIGLAVIVLGIGLVTRKRGTQ